MNCPKCGRAECELLATIIVGTLNYAVAVRDCILAQRRKK